MYIYKYKPGNPRCYENIEDQLEAATCTVWCVHLNLTFEAPSVHTVAKMPTQSYVLPHYVGGGAWHQWGNTEPMDADDRHLVLYFRAVPNHAYKRAEVIAQDHLPWVKMNFAVSTSGDWALQIQPGTMFT